MLWTDAFRIGLLEHLEWGHLTNIKDITSKKDRNDPLRTVIQVNLNLFGGKNNGMSNRLTCPISGCPMLQQDPLSTPDSVHFLNSEALRLIGYPLVDGDTNLQQRLLNQPELAHFRHQRIIQVQAINLTSKFKFGLSRSNLPPEYIKLCKLHNCRNTLLSDTRKSYVREEIGLGMHDFVEFRLGHTSEGKRISSLHYMNENMRSSVILGGLRSSNLSVREKVFVEDRTLEEDSGSAVKIMINSPNYEDFKLHDPMKRSTLGFANLDLVWHEMRRKYSSKWKVTSISFRQLKMKVTQAFVAKHGLEGVAKSCGSKGYNMCFSLIVRRCLYLRSREYMLHWIKKKVLCYITKQSMKKRG